MWSIDQRALKTTKLVIITLASTLISLFFVLFYLQHANKSDVLGLLTFDFIFPSRPTLEEPVSQKINIKIHEEVAAVEDYEYDVELVVASLRQQNTSWYSTYFPDWKSNIYIVDEAAAPLTVPQNKGNEAMVYLTYIIDRYDSLPNNTLFLHAERFQWHNDNPDYDGYPLLRDFQFTYLQEEGYVNLRCVWTIGCPAAIHPFEDEVIGEQYQDQTTGEIYKQAFEELLPGYSVPGEVGVSCCAQFAVTKEVIRQRPKEDYIRFRDWLLNTHFQDGLSGRFFEYSWHIIFGKDPVYCPSAVDCYCKVYGMCDLPNCSEGECDGQYYLPAYSTLPQGWPRIGWDGEASRAVVTKVILTNPNPPRERIYQLANIFAWIGFGLHIISLGMSSLVNQILTVVALLSSTVITAWNIGADHQHIVVKLKIKLDDITSKEDSRQVALIDPGLTPTEEDTLVAWGELPQRGNQFWWDRYESSKRTFLHDMINNNGPN